MNINAKSFALFAAGWMCALSVDAQLLPLKPFSYREGFEDEATGVKLWAHNGTEPTINVVEPTEERASEGRRSLKLDVTFGTGSYAYFGVPVRVPCAGRLHMSARLWFADGTRCAVGFGPNIVYPPSRQSGCGTFEQLKVPRAEWALIEGDAVERATSGAAQVLQSHSVILTGDEVCAYLDRWAVFLYGQPGQRVVAYLDDVRIEGEVPDSRGYNAAKAEKWNAVQQAFAKRLQEWKSKLEATRGVDISFQALPAELQQYAAPLAESRQRAEALLVRFTRARDASPSDVAEFDDVVGMLLNAPELLRTLTEAHAVGQPGLLFSVATPISWRPPASGSLFAMAAKHVMEGAGCRSEIVSMSAVVHALKDMPGVRVISGDLFDVDCVIPASAVDVRVVKSWYQGASGTIAFSAQKVLLPELLLKDDRLVRVDTDMQINYLRSTAPDGTESYRPCSETDSEALRDVRPVDAASLQPVDVPAGTSREFWFNVRIPADATPGCYTGKVQFASTQGTVCLPFRVRVYPFELVPSRLTYGLYYRGTLSPDGQPSISSEKKSEEQFRAEMVDMRDHGVLYPMNYQGGAEHLQRRAMELRCEAGLPTDKFYDLSCSIGNPATEPKLAALIKRVQSFVKFCRSFGYREIYLYGFDEATGDRLASQRAAWKAVQQAGGLTSVACNRDKTFDTMGALLNCAIVAGPPDPEEARKWHSVGSQVFCYANPQVGIEDPLIYRRNYGLLLWKTGYDGAMDYAYQHGFGHVWNDFDSPRYRDHNFTYPTINGVVGTLQWEGFREAVADARYTATLEQTIARAAADKAALARQARAWLDAIQPRTADLDQTRAAIVEWIVRLSRSAP